MNWFYLEIKELQMSDIRYIAQAKKVAQIETVVVGGTISAGLTFKIRMGNSVIGFIDIASFLTTTTVIADVVAGLVTAFNLTDHPYKNGLITATDASPNVVLTSDEPGLPFEVSLNTPGGSATFSTSTTTANAGPEDASGIDNYSNRALPTSSDKLIFKDGKSNVLFGLEAITGLNKFEHHASYTGIIGLDYSRFWNGVSYDDTVPEYRKTYFKTTLSGSGPRADIGVNLGVGTPTNSKRMCLHFLGTAITIKVHSVAATSYDANRPAVRLLTRNDGQDAIVEIEQSSGGVGIGYEVPGELCQVDFIRVANDPQNNVFVGPGVDWDELYFDNGFGIIHQRTAVSAVRCDVNGGNVEFHGSGWTITTNNFNGGNILDCSSGSTNLTTVNLNGASYDARGSVNSKTIGTLVYGSGTVKGTADTLAINNFEFSESASGGFG